MTAACVTVACMHCTYATKDESELLTLSVRNAIMLPQMSQCWTLWFVQCSHATTDESVLQT